MGGPLSPQFLNLKNYVEKFFVEYNYLRSFRAKQLQAQLCFVLFIISQQNFCLIFKNNIVLFTRTACFRKIENSAKQHACGKHNSASTIGFTALIVIRPIFHENNLIILHYVYTDSTRTRGSTTRTLLHIKYTQMLQ